MPRNYFRCFTSDKPKKLVTWLLWVKWWYNTTYGSFTKMTPFEAVYDWPPMITRTYAWFSKVDQVDQELLHRDRVIELLRDNLAAPQTRMKKQADKHHSEWEFAVVDGVFLRLQPYKQMFIKVRFSMKLSPQFLRPYKALERIGQLLIAWAYQ